MEWTTKKISGANVEWIEENKVIQLQFNYDLNEYRVAVYNKGHLNENKTYYTDDMTDALTTMKRIVYESERKAGHKPPKQKRAGFQLKLPFNEQIK